MGGVEEDLPKDGNKIVAISFKGLVNGHFHVGLWT